METASNVYRILQQEIDTRMPVGFPASARGHDIEMLKLLFTPEEARVAIHLSVIPERMERIHRRVTKAGIDITVEHLSMMLRGLAVKGAISSKKAKDGTAMHSLAQFAVGFFEYQAGRLTGEFARHAIAYMEEVFHKELIKDDVPVQLRVIPVERSIAVDRGVATYDDIRSLVTSVTGTIATIPCVCRESHDLAGTPCKVSNTRRVCTVFGTSADSMVAGGLATPVSKEELLLLLDSYQDAGFVLQPENNRDPHFLCACCGCCCGVLSSLKQFPSPARLYHSNYSVSCDAGTCTGCMACASRCQMDAIVTGDDGKATIDPSRCIGCGNCVVACKPGALRLEPRATRGIPPKTQAVFYKDLLVKKRGFVTLARQVLGNLLFGRKI